MSSWALILTVCNTGGKVLRLNGHLDRSRWWNVVWQGPCSGESHYYTLWITQRINLQLSVFAETHFGCCLQLWVFRVIENLLFLYRAFISWLNNNWCKAHIWNYSNVIYFSTPSSQYSASHMRFFSLLL